MEGKPPELQPALAATLLEPTENAILAGARIRAAQLGQAEELGPAHDLSALLYSLIIRPWASLAIVSPDDGERAWRLAEKLAKAAHQHHYPSLKAVNLLELSADRASSLARAVSTLSALGERKRFVLAMANPAENPIALRVLNVCESALLVLQAGRSRIPDARRTVELIGRHRVMGAVLCSD